MRSKLLTKILVSLGCISLLSANAACQDSAPPPGWQAHWVTDHSNRDSAKSSEVQLPIFRDGFVVRKAVLKAILRISGLGQYEAHVNQHNVTDAVLTPGWTDYSKRVFYDTYDVTALIVPGNNAIGVMLGRGMYDVSETKGRYSKFSRSFGPPTLIAELALSYTDGTTQTIGSDGSWKTASGPITFSSVYGGEDYDARLEQSGWDGPGFDASSWRRAEIVDGPGGKLVPEPMPPIKASQQFDPVAVTHPAPQVTVYDLGQNFAGWPEIEVSGEAGVKVKLVAGELLDPKGFVTQRSANASPKDENSFSYVLKGDGVERWHPRFSYWGFRYVEVSEGATAIHHLDGRFLHDAVDIDGSFNTSNELFNRIHKLINMAMLSNMVSVLTDCPHREKLGWLEQTHLAGASLMYNYDLAALYAKMADDMQDAQLANGMVPDIAPEFPKFEGAFRDSPEWGVADILSTWTSYQFYGDLDQLRQHYDSMARYVAYLHSRTQNDLLSYGLGDWYDIGPGEPGESKLTSKGLTASAVYYQALMRMARIATLTGHPDDAPNYTHDAEQVKAAFNHQYFHPDTNQYDSGSQTADAMPLVVGLVPESLRQAVLANLISDIRHHDNHVTAGDIGYHYVVRALTDGNRSDVLYDMLSSTDRPSYGDQLAHGATSLTEAWDANPNSSQNHFMLGHAEEWFYRGLAGIDFDLDRNLNERIIIHPAVVGSIRDAKATYKSKLGVIESNWSLQGDTVEMTVVIPVSNTATIILPSTFTRDLQINGGSPGAATGIRRASSASGSPAFIVTGGRYIFKASKP